MFKWCFTSLALAGFVAITAPPAAADGPRPFIEIHLGNSRPPAPRRETRSHFPGWGYTWVDGSWDWQGDQWVWIDGRWERPENHAYWVRARYASEYDRWRYTPGHWSSYQVQDGAEYHTWKTEHQRQRDEDRAHHAHDHDHGHGPRGK